MSSSRLGDGTGDRYGDYDISAGSTNHSKLKKIGSVKSYPVTSAADNTWEMNDYRTANTNNANRAAYMHHTVEDNLDDSGSEKRLTAPSHLPPSQISVRTDWTVERV